MCGINGELAKKKIVIYKDISLYYSSLKSDLAVADIVTVLWICLHISRHTSHTLIPHN